MKTNGLRVIGLSIALALLVGCGGAEERKAKHFAKATELYEAGQLTKAELEFKNVLQIDPENTESLYMLGQLAEKKKDLQAAFNHYSRLVKLDPAHIAAQRAFGALLHRGRKIRTRSWNPPRPY